MAILAITRQPLLAPQSLSTSSRYSVPGGADDESVPGIQPLETYMDVVRCINLTEGSEKRVTECSGLLP